MQDGQIQIVPLATFLIIFEVRMNIFESLNDHKGNLISKLMELEGTLQHKVYRILNIVRAKAT